jgi:hypothetical protein
MRERPKLRTRGDGMRTRSNSCGPSPSAKGVSRSRFTLVALGLKLPQSTCTAKGFLAALCDQRERLFAYVLSFAVIGRFWIAYHRLFSHVVGLTPG